MNATHFLAILRVEAIKIFRHPAGRIGLVIAFCFGLVGPLGILWFGSSSTVINGAPLSESLLFEAPQGIIWSLRARNISHIIRLIILAMGAMALAGEIKSRTLREALLRPVPRWAIPVSKWLALGIWIVVANAITWVASALVGALFLSPSGEWAEAAKAMATTTAGDLGLAAIVLLLAALTRSVAASIVLAVVMVLANWFSRVFMQFAEFIAAQTQQPELGSVLSTIRPWLPSYALDGWTAYALPYLSLGDDWWKPLVTLTMICVFGIGLTSLRLDRLDIQ